MDYKLDFKDLRQRVSVHETAQRLGLTLKPDGKGKFGDPQWRTACVGCGSKNDRTLIVTENRGFFCCNSGDHGDQIALVAHVRHLEIKKAAQWLDGQDDTEERAQRNTEPSDTQDRDEPPKPRDDQPLIRGLKADDPRVQKLGISVETAEKWESGFAPHGVLQGFYAVPVKATNGKRLAYIGIAVRDDQPPLSFYQHFDYSKAIFGADMVTEGSLLILSSPLKVILAQEHGINCICFLTDTIGSAQLDALSLLLTEKSAVIEKF